MNWLIVDCNPPASGYVELDNYDEDVFTIEILEKEEIYDKFRFEGESLTPTIERNLIPLVDIGLVKKFDEKHYVKLW